MWTPALLTRIWLSGYLRAIHKFPRMFKNTELHTGGYSLVTENVADFADIPRLKLVNWLD